MGERGDGREGDPTTYHLKPLQFTRKPSAMADMTGNGVITVMLRKCELKPREGERHERGSRE